MISPLHLAIDLSGEASPEATQLSSLIASSDLVMSLLPAPLHPLVAKSCLEHGKNLVTASYVSEEMLELDEAFKAQGLLCLNEVGVDPGMDHMSAMKLIDETHAAGGKIKGFISLCGGLPSPSTIISGSQQPDPSAAALVNEMKYKFSWSPRGVLTAAGNSARYLVGGETVEVDSKDLMKQSRPMLAPEGGVAEGEVNVVGWPPTREGEFAQFDELPLVHLPNRDSMAYLPAYRVGDDDSTMFYRGTVRYAGWAEAMEGFRLLGLMKADVMVGVGGGDAHVQVAADATWADLINACAASTAEDKIELAALQSSLGQPQETAQSMVEGVIGQLGGAAANTPGELPDVFEQAQRASKCLIALGVCGPTAKSSPLLLPDEGPGVYSLLHLFGGRLQSMAGMW
jgi:alpha-aminoadipic semialdehyde synthase